MEPRVPCHEGLLSGFLRPVLHQMGPEPCLEPLAAGESGATRGRVCPANRPRGSFHILLPSKERCRIEHHQNTRLMGFANSSYPLPNTYSTGLRGTLASKGLF
ncbi:hypothetical protein H1C71_023252 [Ictidomys tridecemlineatus]|nr:hypothetical protein H1C71_023252 [Ictidomys tridecemlineatus]